MNIREMIPTKICWLGFAISQLLVWQNAFAYDRASFNGLSMHVVGGLSQTKSKDSKRRPSAQQARTGRNRQSSARLDDRSGVPGDYRSGYAAGLTSYAVENRDGKHGVVQMRHSRRGVRTAEQYAIREYAERDARAERIYRSSQLSAPIIIDAKACKRIGAHGESIYENCQLATTCNARTDVAPCQPAE